MGFFKKIFKAVESAVETVTKPIEQAIVRPVVEAVKDVGRDVDDFVNDAIPGGWGTVAAVTAVAVGAPPGTFSGGAGAGAGTAAGAGAGAGTAAGLGAADAITAAEWFGGTGAATAPGAIFGSTAAAAAAPVIEAVPVSTNPTRFPSVEVQQTYTPSPGSFQEALPSFGVETQASQAPYTALAGTFPAAVAGAGGLLATSAAATGLSAADAIRAAQIANALTEKPQQQTATQPIGAQPTQAMGVDYSGLLSLLAQRAKGTGLLGTQFQPQPVNLTSLLG